MYNRDFKNSDVRKEYNRSISFANSIIIGKSLLTECNRSTIHVFKSSHVVNDIDIKSHLATSLLGSSKQIQKDRNWMLSCNPGVWTFG